MFKKSLYGAATALATLFFSAGFTEQNQGVPQEQKVENLDIPKISAAFGHLIGKNLENLGFQFDIDQLVKGLKDSIEGKEPPMSEAECVQAITQIQENAFNKLAQENLKIAEEFLAKNSKDKTVREIEKGKLQYKIEQAGNGAEVQEHFSPIIRYTGKFADGKIFGSSKEDEMITLDETIPGFSKGIIGMKEGEKRTLYIHPELGYGTSGYLPPNCLLTFEIELIKANAPQSQQASLESNVGNNENTNELAKSSEEEQEALR
ncbi:MAG: FKBP-type peptidyl-prolyl cis-trans isomerase [Simkaniaceae bacterium]